MLAGRRFVAIKRLEACRSLLLRRTTSFEVPCCPTSTSTFVAADGNFGWDASRCCDCPIERLRLPWLAERLTWLVDGLNHGEPRGLKPGRELRAVCNGCSPAAAAAPVSAVMLKGPRPPRGLRPCRADGGGREAKTRGPRGALDVRSAPVASIGLIDRARGAMLAGVAMDIATFSMPLGPTFAVGECEFSCKLFDAFESRESPYGVSNVWCWGRVFCNAAMPNANRRR